MIQGEVPPVTSNEPAWYVIHCYSGYENKVRHNLEQRIETMGMKDKIFDVVIPTQEEIEVREGKRRTVERHVFPGYVLVNMSMSEESWYVVRNTPGVTGFVGMGNQPTPLRPEEVSPDHQAHGSRSAHRQGHLQGRRAGPHHRGPFNDFRGTVAEIDMERTKVRVMVISSGVKRRWNWTSCRWKRHKQQHGSFVERSRLAADVGGRPPNRPLKPHKE